MRAYYFLRRWLSIREDAAYGLDASNVVIENVPIVVSQPENMKLTQRIVKSDFGILCTRIGHVSIAGKALPKTRAQAGENVPNARGR